MSKNLTFRVPYADNEHKDGEYRVCGLVTADDTLHSDMQMDGSRMAYISGPIANRLHEFEKLGYEPQQLENIIKLYRIYRHAAHSQYGMCSSYQDTDSLSTKRNDAIDTLWYLYKLAGNVENAECDDIRSMYPSTIFTEDGFKLQYHTSIDFRKFVKERIERVIKRPESAKKIWVTTSSSINDDELMKKVKEAMNAVRGGFTYRAPNTFTIDELHTVPADDGWLRTLPFKVADFDRPNRNGSVLTFQNTHDATKVSSLETSPSKIRAQFGKIARKAFDEGLEAGLKRPVRSGKYPWDIQKTIDKEKKEMFKIKRVLFNNPATIVFWADGDKTVVKAQNGEPYDPEKGLAMAISKKALGNDRTYYNIFAKYCKNKPSEVANKDDLKAAEEDNKTNRALAADALDYLSKAVNDPKATKVNLAYAMEKAIECVNAILDNY